MSKTELDSRKDKKKIKTDGGVIEEEEEGEIDFVIQDGDNFYRFGSSCFTIFFG